MNRSRGGSDDAGNAIYHDYFTHHALVDIHDDPQARNCITLHTIYSNDINTLNWECETRMIWCDIE
jgi:hypothetical protein